MKICKFNKTHFDNVKADLLYEDSLSKEICISMQKKQHYERTFRTVSY